MEDNLQDEKERNAGVGVHKAILNRKTAVAGDPIVGKTSLINRLIYNQFSEEYILTVGSHILRKCFSFESEKGKLQVNNWIWDISGHHTMPLVMNAYLYGTHGALLVCDITREETIKNIRYWVKELKKCGKNIPLVIAVNKIDLVEDKGETVLQRIRYLFPELMVFPTSAKTGENVEKVFRVLNQEILRNEGVLP